MSHFSLDWIKFTKEKFLSLPIERQHKLSAEILRGVYENLAFGKEIKERLNCYHRLAEWLLLEQVAVTFETLSDRYHWHLRASFQSLKEHNLLPKVTAADLDHHQKRFPCHAYLDNLRSSFNVGNIIRTAESAGFESVFFSDATAFVDNPKVQKSAMGSEKWIFCQKRSIKELPRPLIALETAPDGIAVSEFIFPDSFTLAVGNEEYGCTKQLLKEADLLITIPLQGIKNSLNVAQAFAIAAFSASKDFHLRKKQRELKNHEI